MINSRLFCKHCLYQLGGLTRSVCPECGRSFNLALRRSFSRHPHLRRWRLAIAAALFVPALLYIVSYFCVVQVQQRPRLRIVTVSGQTQFRIALAPTYRFGGATASSIYGPLHTLDRKLRPNTWSVPLPSMQQTGQPNHFLWAGM